MDEREALGKIAYDAYQQSKYAEHPNHITPWTAVPDFWQRDWIAAAQAVAERVMQDLQVSVEASE